MLASVTVIGNMGKDVEVKNLQSGGRVGSFSLAVTKYEKGGKKTMWVNIVCWDEKKIDLLQSYTSKGSKLYVRGDLNIRDYTTKDGATKTATEVVIGKFGGELGLLDRKSEKDTGPADSPAISGDDIPF